MSDSSPVPTPLQAESAGANRQLELEIAEKERVQAALQNSENNFAAVFRGSPDAMIISRLSDGAIVDVNETMLTMSGYTRDEYLGRPAG